MCKCVKIIESCSNCGLTCSEAIVKSMYIICTTIIVYKLISIIYDSMYIIRREHIEDKLWNRILVSTILVFLIVLAIFSIICFSNLEL